MKAHPLMKLNLMSKNVGTNIYQIEKELVESSFLILGCTLKFIKEFPQISAPDLIL